MNKHDFSVINYTDQEIPCFEEKQGQKFVSYGHDDLYGDYLRDLFLASSTNGAIINGVADMIYGGGLDATDRDDSDSKREQWLRLQDLLRKSSDDLLQKVAFDLKLYGMSYVNVIWNKPRTRIACLKHLPVHTMRSGVADSEGVVSEYFYKSDWKDRREKEKAIKAFSLEDRTAASTCFQIKRYTPSLHYYSVPDYAGGTNYCELDQRISDFHLSNIRRGFFPSMLLSFKNGVPTQEERRVIEQKVIDKFTGNDNAGRILITFNDGDETAPEFTPIQQNGADGMYEYLSKLVSEKILTAHRVVSPLMFGIRSEGGGFGNNADELRDSYSLFNNTVIAPFQDILLKSFGMLFGINDIELDLFFITAKPADFLDLDVIDTLDEGEQQKEGVSTEVEVEEFSQKKSPVAKTEFADALIELGEDESELLKSHDMIDARKVDYDREEQFDAMWTFATVPSSKPQAKSDHPEYGQDTELIKVRYAYMPHVTKGPGKHKSGKKKGQLYDSRPFCEKMVKASIGGKVYRREDIMFASDRATNPGWGPGGTDFYNIWFYKGGGSCQHFWERRTYLVKNNERVSVNEAKKIIQQNNGTPLETNDAKVARRPRDMQNRGFINPEIAQRITTPRN
ncbi:MAG: hypothetical protein CMC15_13620 [Flavobacteriaceae bacterium]|nr:hypothetical protein [Flavobacteriaceae bacterium]|tara:strand:+ start:47 stop:1915 length:1869 start_codon:yes stop_codon:yes gene_type:complete